MIFREAFMKFIPSPNEGDGSKVRKGFGNNRKHRIFGWQKALYCLIFLILSLATVVLSIGQTKVPSPQTPAEGTSAQYAPWDNAQTEESKSPLLAGKTKEAIAALTPLVKQYPGDARIPYTLATIFFRTEDDYDKGIPYALEACRDKPEDVRYRWMLRTLTILGQHPINSIPLDCALATPAFPSSPVHFVDVAKEAGVDLDAMGRERHGATMITMDAMICWSAPNGGTSRCITILAMGNSPMWRRTSG